MTLSRRLLFSTLALSLMLTAGCPSSNAPSGDKPAAGAKIKVAFVTNNSSDFWTIARKGTEKADAELDNVEVEFKMPANGTPEEQKTIIDGLIADGTKGIAISPKDPANQTPYLNEIAKKVVLVTQDSDAPDSERACYIGTDNVAAGRQAGELIKGALPAGGKIVLFVGSKDAQNAKERIQGITEAIKGTKIVIADTRTDDADHAKAKTNASDILNSMPDVAALVGLWSYNTPGIIQAVKGAGKTGKVKIIGFDEEDDTLQGVKDGIVEGTVVQQPFEFGYQSVKLMAAVIGGDKSKIPASKKQIVETKAIKKADVDAFWTKLKELRGKS